MSEPRHLTAPIQVRPTPDAMLPFHSDSVVEGDPVREVLPVFVAGSSGNQFRGAIWTCTPCTLRFETPIDAVMYVIEGAAEVDFDDGTHWSVQPGDVLAVPCGTWATWRFTAPFKEFVAHAG